MIYHGSDKTLRPVLKQIEQQLDQHIAEACKTPPAAEETTGRLQKLSETLADAAESARAAAALRRQLRANKGADRGNAERRAVRDVPRLESPVTAGRRAGTPARGVEARRADASEPGKE